LLPALPAEWRTGAVSGLRARGAVTIDIEWRDGRAMRTALRPDVEGTVVVAAPPAQRIASVRAGRADVPIRSRTDRTVTLRLRPGTEYVLAFAPR
jgi:alpha-L-fucosidase 2